MSIQGQCSNDAKIIGIPVNGNPSALTPVLQFNPATFQFDWVAVAGATSLTSQMNRPTATQNIAVVGPTTLTNMGLTLPNTGKKALITVVIQYLQIAGTTAFFELIDNGVSVVHNYQTAVLGNDMNRVFQYQAVCNGQALSVRVTLGGGGNIRIEGQASEYRSSIISVEGFT